MLEFTFSVCNNDSFGQRQMEIVVSQLHLIKLMCQHNFQYQETAERTPASIRHILTFDSHQAIMLNRDVALRLWIVGQDNLVLVFTGQSDQVNDIITNQNITFRLKCGGKGFE